MPHTRKKPAPNGKIEKPEDRLWKEEFDAMTIEDHEKALRQLGLDTEDIEEWEHTVGMEVPKHKKKKDA